MGADKEKLIIQLEEDIAKYKAKVKELEALVKSLQEVRARL